MASPKLFISYSWSNASHEKWVLDLATELRESGVDVILDKWDLREGHDAVAFMEKMVTDTEIKKVIIITDKIYVDKADGRSGGVGTETQIISKEVYENQEQDKFVAVIVEKDENGKPYLPAYYKSRIYIDLSEPDNYTDNFEQLLRWIYDKPLYIKPDLGEKPAFLEEDNKVSLGTSISHKRALSAIKEHKAYALGALDEYFTLFSENLEKFRLIDVPGEFDDAVVNSIEQFIPYRNEAIKIFMAIAQYSANDEFIGKLHRFFESLIHYMHPPKDVRGYSEWAFDNFKFIVHELFLYVIVVLIKYERFEQVNTLLTQQYYLPEIFSNREDVMVNYTYIRETMKSLRYRDQRLNLRRLSVRADLLNQRISGTGLEFWHLMQADFVLFMRSEIEQKGIFSMWWPETLLYVERFHGAFEIFARAKSKAYFDKVKCMLSIENPKDLDELLEAYSSGERKLPRWEFDSFHPVYLLGYENLGTLP